MPRTQNKIKRVTAAAKDVLTERETEALKLLRELKRAERKMPAEAPRRLRHGNRYVAH